MNPTHSTGPDSIVNFKQNSVIETYSQLVEDNRLTSAPELMNRSFNETLRCEDKSV